MIDIHEIQVGDYLQNTNGNVGKVIGVAPYAQSTPDVIMCYHGNGTCFSDPNLLEPIPITPEILEKNGFKMAKWKEDEPAGLLGKWWDNRGQVLVKRFDFTLLGEVYSVKANNSRISNIRYVHELQHALRLCKIGKEIVL